MRLPVFFGGVGFCFLRRLFVVFVSPRPLGTNPPLFCPQRHENCAHGPFLFFRSHESSVTCGKNELKAFNIESTTVVNQSISLFIYLHSLSLAASARCTLRHNNPSYTQFLTCDAPGGLHRRLDSETLDKSTCNFDFELSALEFWCSRPDKTRRNRVSGGCRR